MKSLLEALKSKQDSEKVAARKEGQSEIQVPGEDDDSDDNDSDYDSEDGENFSDSDDENAMEMNEEKTGASDGSHEAVDGDSTKVNGFAKAAIESKTEKETPAKDGL